MRWCTWRRSRDPRLGCFKLRRFPDFLVDYSDGWQRYDICDLRVILYFDATLCSIRRARDEGAGA